jgi:hypothetical protein
MSGDVTGGGLVSSQGKQAISIKELMTNLALWIVAGLMAAVCLTGSSKMFVPKAKLAATGGTATRWVEDFSPGALKAIGAVELLAAATLILRRGERVTIAGDLIVAGQRHSPCI